MQTNKLAIIGSEGFVGNRLVSRLNKNEIPWIGYDKKLKKKSNKNLYLDVVNEESFKDFNNIYAIINLAAEHRDDVKPISKYDDVNVHGAENVCNAARKNNINTIIFTSSVAIYGFAPPGTNENGEPNYFNDYGRTKYLAEQVYIKWQAEDKFNRKVIVRPTVFLGKVIGECI